MQAVLKNQQRTLDQAKIYCACTIDKLNKKFTDKEIDEVFSKESDKIMQLTMFATIACEK